MEDLTETEIGSSVESFQKFLDSQREVFHNQIDHLRRIVVTQCKLTGVNPLSQEMAAGALSIKIGKRPRDLINPKAVKYMQEVFSIKDAFSKKESRDISVQFGATVTQVRDFFASQRTRVRKLIRLSMEKAIRVTAHKEPQNGFLTTSDALMPIDLVPLNSVDPNQVPLNYVCSNPAMLNSVSPNPIHLNSAGPSSVPLNSVSSISAPLNSVSPNPIHLNSAGPNSVPLNSVSSISAPLNSVSPNPFHLESVSPNPVPLISVSPNPVPLNPASLYPVPLDSVAHNPVPLNSAGPSRVDEAPSCSTQDDMLPGLDELDKHFIENIFGLLRKEETFTGQVKLMEWILQIHTFSVLNWFLFNGGVMILVTWLSQAAAEEQTSVLIVTLNVFCHLPLHKAPPEHMSAILRGVNRLRFYRTSDISNRARVLLSRWSKMFARRQAMKKPYGVNFSTDAQDMILKQSIDEIMGNELWQSDIGNPYGVPALSLESSENIRKIESSQALKLLPASTDDPSRKHILGAPSSHTRERRKVQLVEQPGQKTAGRSPQATKAAHVSTGRPMSADDIQKAKMRALFMQNKHGKTGLSSNGNTGMKNGPSSMSASLSLVSKIHIRPKIEEYKKPVMPPLEVSCEVEGSLNPKKEIDSKEPMGGVCIEVKIPWKTPPEIKLNFLWRVSTGENGKEVDVQKNRNRREVETIYQTVQELPSNPKEPWDLEMDYDDTLTPEIPIEQPPDADGAEIQVSLTEHVNTIVAPSPAPSLPQVGGGSATEPDLELLAVLLKNPELVFALTSGQAGNLSSDDTVKLLDTIKAGGAGLAGSLNGLGGKVEEKVEVSLPSPTPSSNPGTSGWRSEGDKNPFSQQASSGNGVAYTDPGVPTVAPLAENTSLVQRQNQATNIRTPQQQASMPLLSQHHPFSLSQTSIIVPENRQPPMVLQSQQSYPTNSSILHTPSSEIVFTMKNLPVNTPSLPNPSAAIGPSMWVETMNNVKPAPSISLTSNPPERWPVPFPRSTSAVSAPTQLQSHINEPPTVHSLWPHTGDVGPMRDSWRVRQSLVSNSPSRVNQNNYEPPYGGPVQPQLRSGPPRERNEYLGDEGFESWSPENSRFESQEYMSGRNHSGGRTNSGWDYLPDNRSRQRNSSGYRDRNRNGNGNRRRH
ncbi:homeobox protein LUMINIDEPENDENS isoform X2 [Populus alba]|uniref:LUMINIDEPENDENS family protein n=2 Tax=Populus TaxID=3689 RepID=A0A4U5QSY1_POPAL|nr:homeobox protein LUMINIDEPENDENS-like isoform X2 [Populus alba]KAJ6972995.1 homeobox protein LUMINIDEPENDENS-like isoform X2 [Populus alba x Populus x berolinensis]TKS14140.1 LUMINIDEPENDENS family protein [Populus alba]